MKHLLLALILLTVAAVSPLHAADQAKPKIRLSIPGNRLNANIVVAGDDGIHWNSVRQAARINKSVGERSPNGQGNFNFAAIAMPKPYGPFYPGAWHPGGGSRSFAIGLEAASVVMEVFAREHDPRTAGKALTDALAVLEETVLTRRWTEGT